MGRANMKSGKEKTKSMEESWKKPLKRDEKKKFTLNVLILGLDLEGRIFLSNKEFEEISGYSDEEIIGHFLWDFLLPKRVTEEVKETFTKSATTDLPGTWDIPLLTKEGEERLIRWDILQLKESKDATRAIIAAGVDQTEFKEMQERLEESRHTLQELAEETITKKERLSSEEMYRTIVDFAKIGIGVVQDEEIIYVNEQAAQIFECSREELKELGFYNFVHPEDKERLQGVQTDRIEKEDRPFTREFKAITKEGKIKYVSLHGTEINYYDRTGTQILVEDITDQKETEKKLEDRRRDLSHAYTHLKKIEEELREKTEKLKGAAEMRSEFMDLVGHELKSFLAPAMTNVDLIRLGQLGKITPDQEQKLEETKRIFEKVEELVEDILDLSRLEANRIKLTEESISVLDLIEVTIEELKPDLERKAHELSINIPEDLPIIEGDPTLLNKVFKNIINNAIQYTPEGGKITIKASPKDEGVHIKVADNGVGIPEDEQDKIFEKFYRVEERTGEARGLGIGLSTAKHFVDLHGGRIWVESEVGEGSTFHVEIPKRSSKSI